MVINVEHLKDHHKRGIMRWITTTNHKEIGTLYLFFSLIMFFVGGIMALVIRDRVKETTTTTGTGTIDLGGASSGYQSFLGAGYSDDDTVYYTHSSRF